MHEVSLMQSLFDLIHRYSREHRLKKITRVVIRIGDLTCVEPESLRFAFKVLSRGSITEGAEFVIERVKPCSACTRCGHQYASGLTEGTCPVCGSPGVLIAGQELHLQTLEGEQAEQEGDANGN